MEDTGDNALAMPREGNLEAPTRHPLDWTSGEFWNHAGLDAELERVFEICHGCRRCVSLCHAFPTLFDLVDESTTMEVDGVDKADYGKVVEQCYLCDLCYQTKCPYVPPHPWNVDFPHLMLRAKAVHFREHGAPLGAKVLASTGTVGKLASIPVVVEAVNWGNRQPLLRKAMEGMLGVHRDAQVPEYHADTAKRRLRDDDSGEAAIAAGPTTGKVAIFSTCYGNHNRPQMVEDLAAVLRHNGIAVKLVRHEQCCGMPRLELGDLDAVARYKERNLPLLLDAVEDGWDLLAPIPSCVLMFKQELPLMFPGDPGVQEVKRAFFDPFDYLMHRHRAGLLKTDFAHPLGTVALHAPCHQRVQNIGPRTRQILELIPGTTVTAIERCSGHDGTYGVKKATYERARRIARPVENRVAQAGAAYFASDCPMAAAHIAHGLDNGTDPDHPLSLLRRAYGI
jgi:Fe-S oxidoreductase